MPLEAGTYITDLNQSNPVGATDPKAQGDDHIRLLKTVLKNTLPNSSRAWYVPDASAKTALYTVVAADESKLITCDATGGAFQITLPVSSISAGMKLRIVKIDATANAITIAGASGTINGAASLTLTKQYSGIEVVWNGSTWYAFRSLVAGFEGNADIDGTLNVDGATTLAALTTSGAFTANGTVEFNQDVQIDGPITVTESTLVDGVTIAWDMDTVSANVRIVLGASRTLGAPSNLKLGQKGHLLVVQDGTGGWGLTLNALFKQPGGATICDLDKAANAETLFDYEVISDSSATTVIKLTHRYSEGKNSIGFYKEYSMGTLAISTTLTQAHLLGRYPSLFVVYLECTSTDIGYAVGDRIDANALKDGADASRGPTIFMSTTNAKMATGAEPLGAINPSSNAFASLTVSKWAVYFRVYE